jgi:hypothetical protein
VFRERSELFDNCVRARFIHSYLDRLSIQRICNYSLSAGFSQGLQAALGTGRSYDIMPCSD